MADQTDWLTLWKRASQARASGQISRALELFPLVLASFPPAGEPFHEAADLGSALNQNLAGVGRLYAAHCADMGIVQQECPPWIRLERLLREARYSVVDNLLSALKFDGQSPTAWLQIAQALRAVGRADLAWPHLRRAIQFGPNSATDSLDISRLLATFDGIEDAREHHKRLTERWRADAESLLRRISADEEPSQAPGTAEFGAKPLPLEYADLVEIADQLVALTHRALVLKLSEHAKAPAADVLEAAAGLVTRLPGYGPAHLAVGLAALGAGDAGRARRCFATASLLCEQAGFPAGPAAAGNGLGMALATARACLLDPAEPSVAHYTAPAVDDRLLKFTHARALRSEGDAFAALSLCDDAVASYFVRQTPMSYEFYKGYKILAYESHYYAVPRSVHEFIIIDGVVCKPSRAEQYARIRLPRWVKDLLRRTGGKGGRAIWSLLRNARRRFYAVPGVKVADDFDALLASIDRSDERGSNA